MLCFDRLLRRQDLCVFKYIYYLLREIFSVFWTNIFSIIKKLRWISVILVDCLAKTNKLSLLFCKISVDSSKYKCKNRYIFSFFLFKINLLFYYFICSMFMIQVRWNLTIYSSNFWSCTLLLHINHSKTWLLTNPFYDSFFFFCWSIVFINWFSSDCFLCVLSIDVWLKNVIKIAWRLRLLFFFFILFSRHNTTIQIFTS